MLQGLDREYAQVIVFVDGDIAVNIEIRYGEGGRQTEIRVNEDYPLLLVKLILLQTVADTLPPSLAVKLLSVCGVISAQLDRIERSLPPEEEWPF